MDVTDAKGIIFLMGSLWTNYRMPQGPEDEAPLVAAWCGLFRSIPRDEVEKAVYSLAAEGRDFPPQIGQVYARVRARREETRALTAPKRDLRMYDNCLAYALVTGQPPPTEDMSGEELWRWFCETKERVLKARREAEKEEPI